MVHHYFPLFFFIIIKFLRFGEEKELQKFRCNPFATNLFLKFFLVEIIVK